MEGVFGARPLLPVVADSKRLSLWQCGDRVLNLRRQSPHPYMALKHGLLMGSVILY